MRELVIVENRQALVGVYVDNTVEELMEQYGCTEEEAIRMQSTEAKIKAENMGLI